MKGSIYIYCPKKGVTLSTNELRRIIQCASKNSISTVTVNLGRDEIEIKRLGSLIMLGNFQVNLERLQEVLRSASDDCCVFLSGEHVYKIAFYREGRYYKLKNVGENLAPTLEISGIHMHNIVGTDPWSDAKCKVGLLGLKKGETVLDVCTGLGYTASHAVMRGTEVVTIEADPVVLEIAEHNPWSSLLAHPNVTVILGDAFEVLDDLPENSFHAAIHDPPTFKLAGELYSLEFYKKLRRVLKREAKVFHYTGWPGKHRGRDVQRGVIRRMRAAGFRVLKAIKGYGIVAKAV